jgi:uncharacterized protein
MVPAFLHVLISSLLETSRRQIIASVTVRFSGSSSGMPKRSSLLPSLQGLATLNAASMKTSTFDLDFPQLLQDIARLVGSRAADRTPTASVPSSEDQEDSDPPVAQPQEPSVEPNPIKPVTNPLPITPTPRRPRVFWALFFAGVLALTWMFSVPSDQGQEQPGPPTVVVQPKVPAGLTDCDRLAGSRLAPRPEIARNPDAVKALPWEIFDVPGAVTACETAQRDYPDVPLFGLYLARALSVQDKTNPRIADLIADGMSKQQDYATLLSGHIRLYGYAGRPVDPAGALVQYEAMCTDSVRIGCGYLGSLLTYGAEGVKAEPARGIELLGKACSEGEAVSCVDLGDIYLTGDAAQSMDPSTAFRYYDDGCKLDYAKACGSKGRMMVFGEGTAPDVPNGMAVLDKACTDKNGWSCVNLGDIHRYGQAGQAVNLDAAFDAYYSGCALNDVASCGGKGRMMVFGEGTAPDALKGMALLDQACTDKNGVSCATLGEIHRIGQAGQAVNLDAAFAAFDRGCALNDVASCGVKGHMLVFGEGIAPDAPKGMDLLDQACTDKHGWSCDRLGDIYKDGAEGQEVNLSAAFDAYEKGCTLNHPGSCGSKGRMMVFGEGIAPDVTTGMDLLEKACADQNGWSCGILGNIYLGTNGIKPVDRPKALARHQSACGLNSNAFCSIAGTLLFEGTGGVTTDLDKARQFLKKGCPSLDRCTPIPVSSIGEGWRLGFKDDTARTAVVVDLMLYSLSLGDKRLLPPYSDDFAFAREKKIIEGVQRALKPDFYSGSIDGIAGKSTIAAMKEYCRC